MKLSTAAALASLIASASAHATFQYFWTDASTSTNTCARTPANNNPTGSTASTIACNTGGNSPAQGDCTVAAGSTVGVEMHQQPGDRTCTTEAIGGNHDGPVIIYMAKASSTSITDPSSLSWFKVAQEGLITANPTTQTYTWGTDDLNANCGKFFFKIPSDIASGSYLLRAEVIALHVAGSAGGAQHYETCYQLQVTGGGSANPPGVKFPGAYSQNDPGILFNIYTSFTTYPIPGPTVYGGGGPVNPPTTTPGGTTSRTTTTTTTTTTRTTTTTASGPTQTLWGQCGGSGYSGPTACPTGSKCNKQNDFYSQCIPA
ncbi:carbohydrate-binding module family 1 protein [Tulasnella calospora MUT 4182]|uniref:AA9 family lytic polysaccharide monooxygenase n=1 Tax=Tulasnella calospora MUT 4182 TaxID=1051891 RepID=A0A0C3KSE8_9AGAM|nr:carbohydrate-binding module family 1 protein [Tulasnella calospora MUT 4182]